MTIKSRLQRIESEKRQGAGYLVVDVREGETKAQALKRKTNGEGAQEREAVFLINPPDA